MNVWKVILVTLVIFSSGVITGSLVTRRAAPSPAEATRQWPTNPPSMSRPERLLRSEFLTKAREELALAPEQIEEVEQIVRDSQGRMRALWDEVSPRMRAEFNDTLARIRGVLTPEQQAQFEALMKKHQRSRRGDRPHREEDEEAGVSAPGA